MHGERQWINFSLSLRVCMFHFLCSFFSALLCFCFIRKKEKIIIIIKSMHSFDCTLLVMNPVCARTTMVYAHHATNKSYRVESRCMNFRDGCDYIYILTYISIKYKYKCVSVCVCLLLTVLSKGKKAIFVKGVHKIICSDSTWECKVYDIVNIHALPLKRQQKCKFPNRMSNLLIWCVL